MHLPYRAYRMIFGSSLLLSTGWLCARPVKIWSDHELFDAADLIAIVTAESSADKKNFDTTNAKDDTLVPVETVMKPSLTFKGDKLSSFTLVHNRYFKREAEIRVIDGAALIRFDTSGATTYLVFLKKVGDGFEPVTGQYDPWGSIRIISAFQNPPATQPAR